MGLEGDSYEVVEAIHVGLRGMRWSGYHASAFRSNKKGEVIEGSSGKMQRRWW